LLQVLAECLAAAAEFLSQQPPEQSWEATVEILVAEVVGALALQAAPETQVLAAQAACLLKVHDEIPN
jgi:hypothetical protein